MEAAPAALDWMPFAVPVGAAAGALLVCAVVLLLLRRASGRSGSELGGWIASHLRGPLLIFVPALAFRLGLPLSDLAGAPLETVRHGVALLLMLGAGWLLIATTAVVDEFIDDRFLLGESDNLRARRVHTKFGLLRRVLVILVVLLTGGAMLTTFPAVRAMGAGLLASAGVAGLVIGLAARPTVEMALAGVRLALSEPINLDDVLVVEGEWGRVEEIRATYVVIRIWDDRRLIVPVDYFLTHPFQNWTRVTAELTAQVSVEVDYTTPVEAVRVAAGEIVESSPHWDRRFWNLQVTEAGERTTRLRVLATAADSPSAWELRCEIRERLLAYLGERHAGTLPRVRLQADA